MQQHLPLKARPSCLVVGCSCQTLGKPLQDPLRNAPGTTTPASLHSVQLARATMRKNIELSLVKGRLA
eukprot:2660993-Amphidinium_carterae.1